MKNKFSMAISLAVILTIVVTSLALADQIVNNTDATVDSTYEVKSFIVGDLAGTVGLYVVPTGTGGNPDDGKSGCNLTGQKTLVVSVSSSDTAVAAVSPDKITFSSCGDTPSITITPGVAGSADITLSQYSNNTGGTFDLTTATFTIKVANPIQTNNPPSVTVTGVVAGESYEYDSVPATGCLVTDAEDGLLNDTSAATLTLSLVTGPLASFGLGAQTATCSYTDQGGLTTAPSVTYAIVDIQAPTASPSISEGTVGDNGWYTSDVTVDWNWSDAIGIDDTNCTTSSTTSGDGMFTLTAKCKDVTGNEGSAIFDVRVDTTAPTDVALNASGTAGAHGWFIDDVTITTSGKDEVSGVTCTDPQYQNTETAGTVFNGSCTNGAGLKTDAALITVKLDKTGPTAVLSAVGTLGTHGWYVSDVTIKTNGSDTISNPTTCTLDQSLATDTLGQTFNGFCTNDAGLTTNADALTIKRDATPPVLNISGAAGGSYGICSGIPEKPTFGPTDSTSGVASSSDNWTTPATPSGVGTYTYSATATDNAGNTTSETKTYKVTYGGAFSGYLQPINTDGSSRFKLGSTIPVKFQLKCGATPIANATAWMYVAKGDSVPDPGVDEAISTAASTTGNLFRYDITGQQYIFNLSTKLSYTNPGSTTPVSFSTGTWTLKILLDDGVWYSVNIQLPK